MAGATSTTSTDRARAMWGTGSPSSDVHNDVRTGSDARAERVTAPTKRSASAVITGTTWAPASTSRRHTSTAL